MISDIYWYWDLGDDHSSMYQNPSSYYSRNGDFTATLAVSALGCPGGVTKTRYQYIYLTRYPLMGIKISASVAPIYGCDLSQFPFTFPALLSNTHRRLYE